MRTTLASRRSFSLSAPALGSRRPINDDLRRAAQGKPADEASVDVFIVPAQGNQFSTELTQHLVHVQRDPRTRSEIVGIRIVFKPSREGALLSTRRSFLQLDDNREWISVPSPKLPDPLMHRFEAHLLDASRDLVEEVGNRTSIWGRVLADLQIERDPAEGEGTRHNSSTLSLTLLAVCAKQVRS